MKEGLRINQSRKNINYLMYSILRDSEEYILVPWELPYGLLSFYHVFSGRTLVMH